MKEIILKRFSGQCCSISDIVSFVMDIDSAMSRKTIIWHVNDLVKRGYAVRVGRGAYEFTPKLKLQPTMGDSAKAVCSLLGNCFKYLDITVADSSVLGQFMNLQPFATVVVIETRKSSTNAVISALRNEGIEAYAKSDFTRLEQYISSSQPVVVRSELSVNPTLPKERNVRVVNIEKLLVDLVCDQDVYGQYQGEELLNIYENATSSYAVNYSQMLKYATSRKKKTDVLDLLQSTSEYGKVAALI